MSDQELSQVRLRLADARNTLRLAQDGYQMAKLTAEFALIDKAGGDPKAIGSSEEMRKRAFEAAALSDEACQTSLRQVREAQLEVGRLEAVLDILLDARREREMDLRERNIVVLEGWAQRGSEVDAS